MTTGVSVAPWRDLEARLWSAWSILRVPRTLPDDSQLAIGLTRALTPDDHGTAVHVVGRAACTYQSSFPLEIVTCRIGTRELRVFCKYEGRWRWRERRAYAAHGHRHGLAYEGQVYRHVLGPLRLGAPELLGVFRTRRRDLCLVLQYLEGTEPLHRLPSEAVLNAAQWIGRYHAAVEARLCDRSLRFLSRYDRSYYEGWRRRTLQYAAPWIHQIPELETLARRYCERIEVLLDAPMTVVHGEYYPSNILGADRAIAPVDWETAAVAAGEIDLAAVMESWTPEVIAECERRYVAERWPSGGPADFGDRVHAARLYLAFRWLGEMRAWASDASRGASARLIRRLSGEER